VDQSRRVLRAKSRGRKVHPDGSGTPSSRGSDVPAGTPGATNGTQTSQMKNPRPPLRGAGRGTCLDVIMALMGFGRGGRKALAAAERARSAARGESPGKGKRSKRNLRSASTRETLEDAGGSSRISRHRTPRRTPRGTCDDGSHAPNASPSRSGTAMRFTPVPGTAGGETTQLWNGPSPLSRGTEIPGAGGYPDASPIGRRRGDGWDALRAAQARRELFTSTPSDKSQSRGW
jgi:hypothetical protein